MKGLGIRAAVRSMVVGIREAATRPQAPSVSKSLITNPQSLSRLSPALLVERGRPTGARFPRAERPEAFHN